MAILSTSNVTYREGGTFQQDDVMQEVTEIYQIESDSTDEDEGLIIAAVGVDLFDPHPNLPLSVARRFNIRREPRSRTTYLLEIFYTNQSDRQEPEEEDPLDRQIRIRWGSQTYQKFVWKDRDGDPIVNSVGDFFEDVPSIDDTRWTINIESNQTAVPSWVLNFPNKVNDSSVDIDGVTFSAETLKMQQLSISEQLYHNGIPYRRVSYELHYRAEGWDLSILDRGWNEVEPNDQVVHPVLIPFTDALGNDLDPNDATRRRPAAPWPLDGNGEAIRNNPIAPGDQVFLDFDVYTTADFSSLPGVT